MFGNGLITAAASNDIFNHIERWHDINGEEVKILGDNEFSTLVGFGMGCVKRTVSVKMRHYHTRNWNMKIRL